MKRSEINQLIRWAQRCFEEHGWTLPPGPRWDVTDFGLGDWHSFGLVLVNLSEQPEYCEKLMYARRGMTTPAHAHRKKKEDIICRWGELAITVWPDFSKSSGSGLLWLDGESIEAEGGSQVVVESGQRVTLIPGAFHEFVPLSEECIIGEVSTANDDINDNVFVSPDVGRFSRVEEDEAADVRLVGDYL